MHWVIQGNMFHEDKFADLIAALVRFEIPHSLHKVVPFVGELEPDIDIAGRVICIGTHSMRHIAKKKNWYPGVFDLAEHDFRKQLERWGEHMLNYDSRISRFEDAYFNDDYAFIRPIDDTKHFSGLVTDRITLKAWQKQVCELKLDNGTSLTADTMVQVNDPLEIWREVRYWIVKGDIVTSSVYKTGKRVQYFSNIDETMDQYVRDRVSEWQPREAFVIDVCETEIGHKIVEINTLNSSGFYAADMQKYVHALEEAFG